MANIPVPSARYSTTAGVDVPIAAGPFGERESRQSTAWLALPEREWEDAVAEIPKPWPRSLARIDLRYHEAMHRRGFQIPGRNALALRWGWTERNARTLLERDDWHCPISPVPLADMKGQRPSRSDVDNADSEDPLTLFEAPGPMNHADVVARAARWLRGYHRCTVVVTELVTSCPIIPDAIGWRMSWSVLVEAKVSRNDFKADQKKLIHTTPDTMPGQERWYLTPPNLIRPDEVPPGWGLAECGKSSIRIVVTPDRRFDSGPYVDGRSRAEMPILLSLIRRQEDE